MGVRSLFYFLTACIVLQTTQAQTLVKPNGLELNIEALQKIAETEGMQYALERVYIEGAVANGKVFDRLSISDNAETQLKTLSTGAPIYYITDNANAAISIGANKLHTGGGLGYTLNGQGMQIGEWDGGATLVGHQEFGNRATQSDNATSLSNHATHVAGTMIASGVQVSAKGMAPQASLLAHDWNNDNSEMATAASNGLILSNHSYGILSGWANGSFSPATSGWHWFGDPSVSSTEDYKFGYYSDGARVWDEIANNAPNYLIVKSAGNDRNQYHSGGHYVWQNGWSYSTVSRNPDGNADGYDCISGEGVSKNVMTIGAVDDVLNYSGPSSVTMSWFSGWGPTDDGRIKPDLVANGVSLYSAMANGTTSYGSMSGTSMSAPCATGGLALVQQHAFNTKNSYLKSSTLKALAIHTAKEAGSAQGPDYQFGWGLLDVEHAIEVLDDTLAMVGMHTLTNSSTFSIPITFSSNPVRITIAWNDPAGTPVNSNLLNNTTSMLVNDLDVRLTSPSGQVYYPYVLNPNSPSSVATLGDNSRDNIEMIDLPNGVAPGVYSLSVSHKGTLVGNQEFALILTGRVPSVATPACQVQIQSSKSVTCVPGDSVLIYKLNLGGSNVGNNLLWSTGETTDSIWVTPSQTTTYWLQSSAPGVTCSDSVEVQVSPPSPASITSEITTDNLQTSVSLTASSGISYLWSDSSTSQVLSVYPDSTTTYSVTVVDQNGCSSSASFIVETTPITFLLDLSTQIVDATKGVHIAGNFQNWNASTTSLIYDTSVDAWTYTHEFVVGDTITYKFINGNDWLDPHDMLLNGCGVGQDGARWVAVGNVNDTVGIFHLSSCDALPPVNPLVDSLHVCSSSPAQLNLPTVLTNILWSTGDTLPSLVVSSSGTYWVSALYPNGVVIHDTIEVIQQNSPSSVISTLGSTSLCPGQAVTLSFDTSYVASLIWAPSQDTTSTIITSLPGSYYVQYMTNSGCVGYSDTVVVTSLLGPSAALTLSDSSYFCLGDTLSISAEPGHSYMWNTGAQNSTIQVFSSGDYWVEITSTSGCMTQSDTVNTVMLTGVALPVLFTGNAFAANGDTTNIKMIPYNQAFTYTWSVIGGSIIAGQGSEDVDVLWQGIPGDTAVVQLIVDNGLCMDSAILKVFITTVGVHESISGEIFIYPIPASQEIQIDGLSDPLSQWSFIIFDPAGNQVLKGWLGLQNSVDISTLAGGAYYMELSNGESSTLKRFLKIR